MGIKKSFVFLASALFPTYFTKKAFKSLVNPQVRILRQHELKVLDQATQENFSFQDYTIKTYTWNDGHEPVLLVHGWEGQAGNFADLIEVLVGNGYTVHSFDGPSHGFSSKGSASIMEFTQLVGVMIRRLKVKKLVSHSFGSVATTYALYQNRDLKIDRYALLTTPDRFSQRVDQISAQVGISQKVKLRLIDKLEKEFNLKASNLNVSDWVKKIKVRRACIWHDRADKIIPLFQSKTVNDAWPVSHLRIVENTGHFRILRNEEINNEVVGFLKQQQ